MDIRERLIEEFIGVMESYAHPGSSEFYFWEVLEGTRKPSYIAGPPSDEAMDILRLMRDDLEIWLHWADAPNEPEWQEVPIEQWRELASKKNFDQAFRETRR